MLSCEKSLPGVAGYENICAMQNAPSADPRDQAIRAALQDASTLASMVATDFTASYRGADRTAYLATLAGDVTDLGGRLEEVERGELVADFGGRQITVRFG